MLISMVHALSLGASLTVGQFTDNFPDVPENHWAYEAFASIRKAELLPEHVDRLVRGPHIISRTSFVMYAVSASNNYLSIGNALSRRSFLEVGSQDLNFSPTSKPEELKDRVRLISKYRSGRDAIKRLLRGFERDLPDYIDRKKLNRSIDDTTKIFDDYIAKRQ